MFRIRQIAAPSVVSIAVLGAAAGCSENRPDAVPASATVSATGTKDVSVTSADAGNVYVYDETAKKMVYTGKVEKGDSIRVDAKLNKILFNDKVAVERDLTDDHHYKIYVDRDPHAGDTGYFRETTGNTTVIQPRSDGTTIRQGDNTTIVRPAEPAPANRIIVQPPESPSGGTTVVQPAPAGGSVTVQPAR